MLNDPDLMPFEPPPEPLSVVTGLRTFLRNYVESFPRSAYEQPTTRIRQRFSDVLLVCDPPLIHELFVARSDEFGRDSLIKRALDPIIGATSMFLVEGAEWRWQRRAVAPVFRHEALLSYVPVFAAKAARQVERWRAAPPGAPVDATAAMSRTIYEVIVEIMLGNMAASDAARFEQALAVSFNTALWNAMVALLGLPRWMPFPGRRRANQASGYLHREMNRLVAARRAAPSARRDLLDLLIGARDAETGRSMTDAELATNLLTFIAAGHETTTVALTWTLWLVAKDSAVQERLFAEAFAVAGSGPIEATHVEALSFTRQVLQEGMRLFPPAPAISRQPRGETQLGEHRVTPSTQVMVPVFALHRHKRIWEDPATFDPDHFAPERAKGRARHAYLPFGAGPRVCIGASFAMLEAAVVLATLVRAFRFRPVPGHRPKLITRVTMRPQGGLPLLIEPR